MKLIKTRIQMFHVLNFKCIVGKAFCRMMQINNTYANN